MNVQTMHFIKIIGSIIGGIVVTVGLIGGIWSLWDKLRDIKPRLELFVPQHSTGRDANTNQLFLFMLVRISNLSRKNAYLFPETMAVEVKNNQKWHKTKIAWVPNKKHIETDFTKHEKAIQGVEEVEILKRFESPIITYDRPFTRYIIATHEDEAVLQNIDAIRIKVRDSNKNSHVMVVDLSEQQKKYDPDYCFR